MAKIILVTKHVSPTSWQLAQALRAQQHEVIFLTSYGEVVDDTNGIEFMAYFKKWSFFEGVKIIPGLFGLQPQILHFLLEEDRMNPAQMILATFAKSHPSCILTTSLLHVRRGLHRRNPVRYLVEESDIITCPTVETLGQLRGLNVRSVRQGRGILPPVLDLHNHIPDNWFEEDEQRLQDSLQGEPYFVMPFREARFNPDSDKFSRIRTLAQKHKVILWGSYSHWTLRDRKRFASWMAKFECADRWHVTGEISPSLNHTLLQNCEAFVLAGQRFTPAEMTEYYLRAIQAKTVLVLDSAQTGLHSSLWKNTVNCWILDSHHLQAQLVKLLSKSSLKLSEVLSEKLSEDRHLIDNSMNELNRLYNRALTQKKLSNG
ncbi:hypothetical protein D3C87_102600 [compost metagenome]